jgi:hypothetical protein
MCSIQGTFGNSVVGIGMSNFKMNLKISVKLAAMEVLDFVISFLSLILQIQLKYKLWAFHFHINEFLIQFLHLSNGPD